MEIRFYTPELNLIGIMENQTSLLWTRKYYETGSFQLIAPITPYNVQLCKLGNIIAIDGADEAGVIECFTIRQEHSRRIITAVGRFLDSYLDRRLIRPQYVSGVATYKYNGTVEKGMRELIENIHVPLPIVLGESNDFPETIEYQATYKNVLSYLVKLSKVGNIGFKVTPNFTDKTMTFDTFRGVDHSVRQSERTRVIFSEEFENISTVKYQEDSRLYKNVFYIGGKNANGDRQFSLLGDDDIKGLERREHIVNSDINDDLDKYAYRPPTFDQEEPTEKLTNIPVYKTDYNQPIYKAGGQIYVDQATGKEYYSKLGDSGNYLYDSTDARNPSWTGTYKRPNPNSYYMMTYTDVNDPDNIRYREYEGVSKNKTFHFSHYWTTNEVEGYRSVKVGEREETDEEFQYRVDAYKQAVLDFEKRAAEYEENYQKLIIEYQLQEQSIYNSNKLIRNFEFVVNPDGNFKYRRDYDLGDIVTTKKESWGLEVDLRITEVTEIYEHGLAMTSITLGDLQPETIDWEDK